jgi:uncharacterized protein YndB with AHSA1/START domain
MPSSTFEIVVRTAAPTQKVFDLIADATSWQRWAKPFVRHGEWLQEGDPAPGGVGAIRRVGSKAWGVKEQITEYDPPDYLAYTILTWMPVRDYRAIVSIDKEGDGSRITWAGAMESKLPGAAPVMAFLLGRSLKKMATGLARYAEATA